MQKSTIEEIRAWLTLACARDLGTAVLEELLTIFGSAAAVAAAGRSQLMSAGVSQATAAKLAQPDEARVNMGLQWLDSHSSHHLIVWGSAGYPLLLAEIPDPPLVLFAKGRKSALCDPQLAIVGSRNPSPSGSENAFEFARHLADCGLTIVSGLAMGVDAQAHKGALAAGAPTLAICGTGLDLVYPAQHQSLAGKIGETGLLVSEFFPGTPPRRENFPRRNRLISGLSTGVLVVEAGLRSGSLITARLAAEQGREVFAIPGSIHNPLARGCHLLIRKGAKLVETAADVLSELGSLVSLTQDLSASPPPDTDRSGPELDEEYAKLLEACGYESVTVDLLVERTRLTAAEVSSMLLILELQGFLESGPGGRYIRVFKTQNQKEVTK
ncbi:MAG: DNA-processing protein DprA [Gammaproteobacteria bacterium]